uniref:hypothetical protein n=1 Tax=Mycobacterium celatum TaxID=28045 RepID=UPI0015E85024|nr:hypothetical protein [Mycobacterium celatum]
MSAVGSSVLERPRDPHELIGSNWYEIDHTKLAAIAVRVAQQATAASTAEQKTHTDVNAYELALPEGFEGPIAAGRRVGRMFGELAEWLTQPATDIGLTSQAIQMAKGVNTIAHPAGLGPR